MRLALLLAAAALALALAGCGGDDDEAVPDTMTAVETTTGPEPAPGDGTLRGTVGPGFDISLATGDGALAPGSYTLEVEDLSTAHNFHLTGPGVDVSTTVGEEGSETFEIELEPGTYEFVCDPHAFSMKGSFEVGG